jgi:hypothetical protein
MQYRRLAPGGPIVSQVEIRAICPSGIIAGGSWVDRKQIDKILAVALNPGAYDQEAVAALRRAREIVKKNPQLAHPDPPPPSKPPSTPPPKPEHSIEYKVSKVTLFWAAIFLSNLSEKAYGLGLRSKFSCDFAGESVDIRCDGSKEACDLFVEHLQWLIDHINSQPKE